MARVLRRLVVLGVVALIAVGVAASVASADKPANGCSTNYALTPVDPGNIAMVHQDHNGDGWVAWV